MFKPKLLTNQVKLTLFLGMTLILLPLFMTGANADPGNPLPTIPRPAIEERTAPEEKAPDAGTPSDSEPGAALEPLTTLVA